MQLAPVRSGSVLPEDRVDEEIAPIVDSRAAGDGDRYAARVTIRLCNLLKWFHNQHYANNNCGKKGSDVDDGRGRRLDFRSTIARAR